jgi:uncharacterized protein YukJ
MKKIYLSLLLVVQFILTPALFASEMVHIKSLLNQDQLLTQFNKKEYLEGLFSKNKHAYLKLNDGYWLGTIDLPSNANIPFGSKLSVLTTAGWSVKYKDLFTLTRSRDYTFTYNGTDWDISQELSEYIPTNGVDVSIPNGLLYQMIDVQATLNGAWIGKDVVAQIDNLGNGKYAAYLENSTHTKVVVFEIRDGKIKTLDAKYKNGKYSTNDADYTDAGYIATSATGGSYGIHSVKVSYSKYKQQTREISEYLGNEYIINDKFNTVSFLKEVFAKPDILNVNLYNYWLKSIDLPNNIDIPRGSTIKLKTPMGYDVRYANKIRLVKNGDYTLTYTGTTWDIRQETTGYIPTSGFHDIQMSLNPAFKVKKIEATMNGAWIGEDTPAIIDDLGNGKYAAYFTNSTHTKVVVFELKNGSIKTLDAKYKYGSYTRNDYDYTDAGDIATAYNNGSYGIFNVKFTYSQELDIEHGISEYVGDEYIIHDKVHSVSFLEKVFAKTTILDINLYNYWLKSIDLPKGINIPKGSTIKLKTPMGYDVRYAGKINLVKNGDYLLTYNGNGWDITQELYGFVPPSGFHGIEMGLHRDFYVKRIEATMNGDWIDENVPAQIVDLGNGKYSAFHESSHHAKVVDFTLDSSIKTTDARYNYGKYALDPSGYTDAGYIATAYNNGSYGIHQVKITYGEKEDKSRDLTELLRKGYTLDNFLNNSDIVTNMFNGVNQVNINLNDFELSNLKLPSSVNIPYGSKIIMHTSMETSVSYDEKFNLVQGGKYVFTFVKTGWQITQELYGFVPPTGFHDIQMINVGLPLVNIEATMNGDWIDENVPAQIDSLGNGEYAAYHESAAHAKVVVFEIKDNSIKTTDAKYNNSKYTRDETTYIDAGYIATAHDNGSYGIHNVKLTFILPIN